MTKQNMKTFTQEEVATILKTNSSSVFERMTGRRAVTLYPSIIIKNPITMQRTVSINGDPYNFGRGTTDTVVEEKLNGVFGITGIRPLQWDENGFAQITFGPWPFDEKSGGHSGVLLTQGENTYMVKSPLKIRRDELVVTEDDLRQYRKETEGDIFDDQPSEPVEQVPTSVPETISTGGNEEPTKASIKSTGGDLRSGKPGCPTSRFMDDVLKEYRTKEGRESEEFNSLLTYVCAGMKLKDQKLGYEVLTINNDHVKLKIKRTVLEISMNKLEKIWKGRKMRNPFKPD